MQKGTPGLVLRLVRAPPPNLCTNPNLTPADTYTHLNSGPVTHPVDSTKAIALLPVRLNPDVPRTPSCCVTYTLETLGLLLKAH